MKKKLLALVLSVVMIAALIVPMMAISADANPTVKLYLGDPVAEGSYIKVPVYISDNTAEMCAINYKVYSIDKLEPLDVIETGTIVDSFTDKLGRPQEISFKASGSAKTNPDEFDGYTGYKLLNDSSELDKGIKTAAGLIAEVYFAAPTAPKTYTFKVETISASAYIPGAQSKTDVEGYTVTDGADVTYTVECKNHVAGTPEETKPADCENAGEKVTKCTICGFEMNKEVIPALGHDWDNGVTAEGVKCGETADTTYTCQREGCGETDVKTGDVVQHDWKLDEEASVAAKCGVAGKNVYKCQRENCPVGTKEEAVAALEHIWELDEEASVAPKCEEDGKDVYVCAQENCPVGTKEEVVEALGHDFSGEVVVTKAPTADEEGEYTVACVNGCGEVEPHTAKKLAATVEHSVGDKVLISFKSEENILPEDIMPVSDGGSIDEETGKITEKFTFDSVLVDQLQGEAEFSIDTTLGGKYKNFKVYTNDAQGNPVEVEFTFENGVLTFNVDLEGEYTLEYEEVKTSPDTSDASNVVVFAVVALMAVAGLVVAFKKRFAL